PDAPAHPYLTYIDASTFNIVAKQSFKEATAGLEQPRFAHGLLYQAVPATIMNPGGEIDAINPVTRAIIIRYATGNCGPSGLVITGPLAAIGCANGADEMLDLLSGKTIVITDSGAADMVAADPARRHFFFASYTAARVYVTDADGHLLQQIQTDSRAHSVAVDSRNGELYIPEGSLGGVAEYLL
ncbi:MAG TPA: hypothetical protein VFV38_21100, partial [Ktedonobacteraceae bacterium]|nr:hypothetical protein [Ktedonobacteraceae bacterium]